MKKEKLRKELEKFVNWSNRTEIQDRHLLTAKGLVEIYLSKQMPEMKKISELFQEFTDNLKLNNF